MEGGWGGDGERKQEESQMKSIPYSRGQSTHCGCPITSSQLPNSTTRALLPSPLAEDKTEVRKGEVTFPGRRASAGGKPRSERRQQGCGNTRSAEVPPLHAAGSQHPPGRGVRKSPSGRRGLPSPARAAPGSSGSGVLATSAALSRPCRARGRRKARAAAARERAARLSARPAPAGAVPGDGWGKGPRGRPRATHASNLLFILSPPLSPLPHGVTSALPGPIAKGPATSGWRGARRNVCAQALGGASFPDWWPRATLLLATVLVWPLALSLVYTASHLL